MNPKGPRFSGELYTLTLPQDRPFVYLDDPHGNRLAELFVLSSVHSLQGRDDTTAIGEWEIERSGEETVFALSASSSLWANKTYRFRCRPHRFRYEVTVEAHPHTGTCWLAEVNYFGGYSSAHARWGSGFFLSGQAFERGFNPEPSAETPHYFSPGGCAAVDLGGAPLPGKRHWFFTPAPFCFAFETRSGWLGLGVEAGPDAYRFAEYRYHGQTGFYLSLSYDGHAEVDRSYELPAIGFDFAPDEYGALRAHVAALRESGSGSVSRKEGPAWWSRPIFCGWGAQCARAAADHGYRSNDPESVDGLAFVETLRHAPSYSRQDLYEEWLAVLAARGLQPGTVVVDDKWQRAYGENRVDEAKWPDLRAFVRRRHAAGQKVLLWLKAWDREGVLDQECIRNAAGVPLAVDPTNPAYQRRLSASAHHLLSPEGCDVDGFKIDFTHRIPTGPGLQLHSPLAGLELLRAYLGMIHREAKSVKPDALIVTHTPHPYLADLVDMIRLNDLLDLTRLESGEDDLETRACSRAAIARIACPEALIDTDNWPVRSKAAWRQYARLQPRIGVPSLYFATHLDLTQEPLQEEDYQLVREAWEWYRPN